jgi:uncharacterized membrane-anchored protein YitT (DUF2179 family)
MRIHKKVKDYLIVAIAALILAIAFNTTLLPLEIVTGGSSGLSILANHFWGISPSIVVAICYLGALAVGYFALGKRKIRKSIFGTIVYPLWIYITSPLSDFVKSLSLDSSEYLIIVIVGAVISGIAFGLVYKIGYTTGGSDIASQIVNKYFGITIGSANTIINTTIVIAGGFIFGWTQVLYAILTLYVIGIVTDKILLGMSYSKAFYIITDKGEEVKKYIADEFNQSFTELEAKGGYTNHGNHVIMCVVPTGDYFRLKEGINIIDGNAFFLIMDAYELEK